MARTAGEITAISFRATAGHLTAHKRVTLRRKYTAGAPAAKMRHSLAYMAAIVGADALSASISGLTEDAEFAVDGTTYSFSIEQIQDGEFLLTVRLQDPDGYDVDDQREYSATRGSLQDALAKVAEDWGATSLASAIAAI